MPDLFRFADQSLPDQPNNKSFGVESITSFRITSVFTMPANVKAFSMTEGIVLLQQQTGAPDKVNLILKPSALNSLKLRVKYIIYRGLRTDSFLTANDLSLPTTKVLTQGSELLVAMKNIQDTRSPGDDIPLQALFGYELNPANPADFRIDKFFFSTSASASQLFPVKGGIELGKFATGEAGIEIVLDNPEFFPTVEMAKKPVFNIDISSLTPAQKKSEREKIRHFIDPAAFFGLHYDIPGGIEYRDTSNVKQKADTPSLILTKIIDKFKTKNTLYLDIRNENDYSLNYYDNYLGTGAVAADNLKEIKTGPITTSLTLKEYYTDEWPIHIVSGIVPGTGAQNTFYLSLRINDNKRPLLAGWNSILEPNTVIDPPLTSDVIRKIYYADELLLLPVPIPAVLPEFTNAIGIKVPNVGTGTPSQLATLVKLTYIKQALPLSTGNIFPQKSLTDFLFGPLDITIPWDSANKIRWFSSANTSYVDALSDGYVIGQYKTTILSIDTVTKEIEIFDQVPVDITKKVQIENSGNTQNVGTYTPTAGGVTYANGKTKIKVAETLGALQAGDKLSLAVKIDGKMDYSKNAFVIENKNYVTIEALTIGNKLEFYSKYDFVNSYVISSVTLTGADTHIAFTVSKPKAGFAAFAETGLILESDLTTTGPANSDRIMFYAAPFNYFMSNGIAKSAGFGATGGILEYESILKALQAMMPGVEIEKTNIKIGTNNDVLTFAYTSKSKAKEALFLLGLTKAEWVAAKAAVGTTLDATRHKQMFRLISTGTEKTDLNKKTYSEYDLYIAGLTSAGAYQTVNTNIKIYTTDHLIYNSKNFSGLYGIDVTIAEQALMDFINDMLDGDGSEFLEIANATDEEKINLGKNRYWNNYSGGKSNKQLFNLEPVPTPVTNPSFKNIIRDLKTKLDAVAETEAAITDLLKTKGAELLNHAKKQIKDIDPATGNPRTIPSDFKNRDGILYLARHIMQVILKNHPKILLKFPSKVQDFSDVFEKASRGLDGTEKPVFPAATTSKFNLLISGYDPFGTAFPGSYYDKDKYHSNPSGNLALALDGEVLKEPGTGGKEILIKSVVIPTRFREFDVALNSEKEGWMEEFFKPYVNDTNVNMIITFSYGIESSNFNFEIERFAARKRGIGTNDNNQKRSTTSPYLDQPNKDDYEFIETTLPYRDMFIANEVGLDQTVTFDFYSAISNVDTHSEPNPSTDLNTPLLIPFPDYPNYKNKLSSGTVADSIKSVEGPGGDYLSNEIFYRVAYLRATSANPDKPTGHIHIGFLTLNGPSDRRVSRVHMLDIIKQAIIKAIPSLSAPQVGGFMKILNYNYGGNDFFTGIANHTNEELKQLSTYWLTNNGHAGNKELFFLNPDMKQKVTAFKKALDLSTNTLSDVQNLVKDKGAELLRFAKAYIKGISPYPTLPVISASNFKNKDGILYITRLMMQVILKNHPKILANFSSTERNDLYNLFEKHSRGHEGLEKPDFSIIPSGHKKILISGFDPYGAGFDWQDHNSNPSGNLLMALDGKEIINGSKKATVKGALFPTRYKEFDANWVENFFTPYISQVDMIITFSYGIDTHDFQIDRFASDFRYGDLKENDNQTVPNTNLNPIDPFIENKLPYTELAAGNLLTLTGSPCIIGINHKAYWEIFADKIAPPLTGENVTNLHALHRTFGTYSPPYTYWNNRSVVAVSAITVFDNNNFSGNSQVSSDLKYATAGNADEIKFPSWANYPDSGTWVGNYQNFSIKARMGSGQFYLSNEIHYRVAKLRKNLRPGLRSGHIHIGFLSGDPQTDRDTMITAATLIIQKMLNAL
jgi:pyrrolidone-carboxylate peptidase